MKVRVIWKPEGIRNRYRNAETEAPPQALVKTCAYILWGVDRGPGALDQSIAMLKVAVEHGTTDIAAASRASFEYPFDPKVIAQRADEIARERPARHLNYATHWVSSPLRSC